MRLAYSNHLGARLRERKMSREQVDTTIASPDSVTMLPDGKRYSKQLGHQRVTAIVVVTQNGTPLVVSAWIDPPNSGTRDARKKVLFTRYKQAKGLMKWWYAFRLSLYN